MGVSVKSEDVVADFSSSLLNGYQFSSVFDFCEVERSSSLGFMELLGGHDYTPLLDVPQLSTMSTVKASSDTTGKECSEVLNQQQPATPNSCSISSASSEAVNDNKTLVDQAEEDEEEEEKQKTNKQWVFFLLFFSFLLKNIFILVVMKKDKYLNMFFLLLLFSFFLWGYGFLEFHFYIVFFFVGTNNLKKSEWLLESHFKHV